MKRIVINVLLYVIFCEVIAIGMLKVIEGLDDTPIGAYHKALESGMSWSEYIEK